jgi:hypothetical protein
LLAVSDIRDSQEELSDGQALPLIIGLLDPRPQGTGPGLPWLDDPVVAELAACTYTAAATRAAEAPLPPIARFNSSAELSERAGRALQAIMLSPGGLKVLMHAGFYNAAADLLQDKVIPPAAVLIVGALFCRDGVQDQQRLTLARKFVGLGFLQFLLDQIDGMGCYPSCSIAQDPMLSHSACHRMERLTWPLRCARSFMFTKDLS